MFQKQGIVLVTETVPKKMTDMKHVSRNRKQSTKGGREMKRSIKALGVCLLAGAAAVTVTGCGKVNKDYDVYFFNQKSEIADSLNDLADEYEAQTGKKVKVFTVGTTEGSETMRSELKSKEYPTLFSSNAISFEEWKSAGYAAGVEEISNPELKTLYESVPDALKLQFESEGNYGIPYNIEGYGLIADRQMLEDILGVTDLNAFTADYKEADYEEFQQMIVALNDYINDGKSESFTLNGNSYETQSDKTDLTENLNGVFSIAGAEKWTYGNHFGNYPISTVYQNIYDVRESDPDKADLMKSSIVKSLQELDFLSNYAAGPDGATKRGSQFINSTVTGYDQAVQTFAEGKAVFIKNGNWIYSNVADIAPEVADRLIMLPMKLNFSDDDIHVDGLTVDQMNRSVPEFVSQYYIINKKATEQEKKDAEDFLLWLNTSETGQDYIVNKFAFVPFNADEDTTLENPLSNDLITYKRDNDLLANPFDAAPSSWGLESYGKYIMEDLFTDPDPWSEDELNDIADECISYWKSGMDEW